MSTDSSSRHRPRRTSIDHEEEKVWASFYKRRRNPVIAAEIIRNLDLVLELKQERLGLYMCCKETLRQHKARVARQERIAHFIRYVCRYLVLRPFAFVQSIVADMRDIAIASLPPVAKEPAIKRVSLLETEPEFVHVRAAFDTTPSSPASKSASTAA